MITQHLHLVLQIPIGLVQDTSAVRHMTFGGVADLYTTVRVPADDRPIRQGLQAPHQRLLSSFSGAFQAHVELYISYEYSSRQR